MNEFLFTHKQKRFLLQIAEDRHFWDDVISYEEYEILAKFVVLSDTEKVEWRDVWTYTSGEKPALQTIRQSWINHKKIKV